MHGPPGQLQHRIAAALVDLLEPLPLDFFRGALKTANGQFEIIFGRDSFGHDHCVAPHEFLITFPR